MSIGIIYKFTIVYGCVFNGNKPFYVGQHWTNSSLEKFKSIHSTYWGSGKIWRDCIKTLRNKFPDKWKYFIRREILCVLNKDDKEKLNFLEEFFIKKEKSLYTYCLGGCNCLKSSNFINPFFNEDLKSRQSESKKRLFASKRGEEVRKKMREHHADVSGKNNPVYGSKWINNGKETKRLYLGEELPVGWEYGYLRIMGSRNHMYKIGKKHPMYGVKRSEEFKEKFRGKNNPMYGRVSGFRGKHLSEEAKRIISEKAKERYKNPENNPVYGKLRITNGIINKVIDKDASLQEGFWYGMTKKKKE